MRFGGIALLALFATATPACSGDGVGAPDLAMRLDLAIPPGFGGIGVTQAASSSTGRAVGGGAFFETGSPAMHACTERVVAGCTVQECIPIFDGGIGQPSMLVSAGQLSVTGRVAAALASTSMPGYYQLATPLNDLWSDGTVLTATATGDVVPPFTMSLTAPIGITVTAPDQAITLARGADLVLSTMSTAPMTLRYFYDDGPDAPAEVDCTLTASGGIVTVPGAALALAPGGKLLLSGVTTGSTSIDVGGWMIDFSATSDVTFLAQATPGTFAGLTITLQ